MGTWVSPTALRRGAFAVRRSVGGFAILPLRKPGFTNLVNQRAIADGKHLRRLAPVPVIGLKNLENEVALHLADSLFRDSLEWNRAILRKFNRTHRRTRRRRLGADCILAAQNDVARHAVFELADIARPLRLLERLNQFARKRWGGALEARIELREEKLDQPRDIFPAIAQA